MSGLFLNSKLYCLTLVATAVCVEVEAATAGTVMVSV